MVVQIKKLNKNSIQLTEYLKSATNVLTICHRFKTSRVFNENYYILTRFTSLITNIVIINIS